ncbi:signal recognition particle-docking protein FtsY [Marinicella sp. W31]|uniref:signal recognition particle-docking protein FtsY n=1 Tax=Marinicella sp. W31 TaxID=3023713 RepID=UPI0037573771
MIGFFKNKKKSQQEEKGSTEVSVEQSTEAVTQEVVTQEAPLQQKLDKSNRNFGKKMRQLFSINKKIDEDLLEEIEDTLLMADVGATATLRIMDQLSQSVKRRELSDHAAVFEKLKQKLSELAATVEQPLQIDSTKQPFVILVIGVNGVGKTTTIAKLARRFKSEGRSVMLAAGDTFRAAAVEQLKTWGEREDIQVVAQATGADSASVIFDAMSSAKAKSIDVLIADTAGRLHTQSNLMQELEKIGRVMQKNDIEAPHETLIVVDGGTGQNAISQIREFNKATNISGIVITKLDGTAKGGVLFNLADEFKIPVRFIGVGEKSEDLKPYQADDFVDALLH